MIKFQNIYDYDYILSFDLAKNKTGWAMVDFHNNKIIDCGLIIPPKNESILFFIYNQILSIITKTIRDNKKVFIIKEKLPNQAGKFTTIASLQALAEVHAIWEVCCEQCGVDVYDYDGVHSRSVKAYYSKICNLKNPQKSDISNIVCAKYKLNLDENTYDITDAIACADTLLYYKYEKDIKEQIKLDKLNMEKYKSENKKQKITEHILNLSQILEKQKEFVSK